MASPELTRLVADLRKIASPVQRMKLVARAWRSVRRLAPGERRDLALQVGLEGAEELVERLASRGGRRLPPSLLLRALDRIRGSSPDEIVRVVGELRDPERRGDLLQRGIEALTAEPPSADAPAPEGEPAPDAVAASVDPPEVEPPPLPNVEAAVEVAEAPEPVVVATVPRVVAVPPPPRASPEPDRPAALPEPERDVGERGAPTTDEGSWIGRIARAASLTERFRLLRRAIEDKPELPSDRLAALLQGFPPGWPRRRALAALLRAGVPESLEQAVSLIESLHSSRSRAWCASIVLDRWPLTAGERGALIEQHGLFRRRL